MIIYHGGVRFFGIGHLFKILQSIQSCPIFNECLLLPLVVHRVLAVDHKNLMRPVQIQAEISHEISMSARLEE